MREPIIKGEPRGERADDREPPTRRRPGRSTRWTRSSGRRRLAEVIGQRSVAERLAIALAASKKRGEPLPHILFDGPPGLGKTTFATVLHNELGVELNMTSGPALDKKMDVMPYLTNASEGSILFIDEIHRLPKTVEEFIYPVMEDFRVDVVLGEGMSARTINLPLKKFTIIGATTRSGMLSGPLRDRFHMHEHLEFYDVEDLARIVAVNAVEAPDDHHRPTPPGSWPSGAGARPGWPTPGSAGSATTPPPAPTATSPCRSPATRSTCRRSTPRGWTSRTAATWRP